MNKQALEFYAHTPIWMPFVLIILTIALLGIIIYMAKDIYTVNNDIKKIKKNN